MRHAAAGPGALARTTALAADPSTGSLNSAERGVEEEQTYTAPASGTYSLTFEGQTTGWSGEASLTGEEGAGDLSGFKGKGKVTLGSNTITNVTVEEGAPSTGQAFEATSGIPTAQKSPTSTDP